MPRWLRFQVYWKAKLHKKNKKGLCSWRPRQELVHYTKSRLRFCSKDTYCPTLHGILALFWCLCCDKVMCPFLWHVWPGSLCMCVSNRNGINSLPVPTCKQSAIISYISPPVFYKEKLKISRVSSPKSAFLSVSVFLIHQVFIWCWQRWGF